MLIKHFVRFYSPGVFMAEQNRVPIQSWDVDLAVKKAKKIIQRYDARPYGFRFETYGRKEDELNSRLIDKSPMYYLGGVVRTIAEIEAKNDPNDRILLENMRINKYKKVIETNNSYKYTLFLNKDDVVLDIDFWS